MGVKKILCKYIPMELINRPKQGFNLLNKSLVVLYIKQAEHKKPII